MKDKIAAKEQHIADLQKKAQVLWIFLWILLSSFALLLFESHCLAIFSTNSDDKSWNVFHVKLQKLEDELVAARKVSSERQLAVTDVRALHLLAAYLCKSVGVELQ